MKNEQIEPLLKSIEQQVQELIQYDKMVEQKKIELANDITQLKTLLGIKEPEFDIFELLENAEDRFMPSKGIDPTIIGDDKLGPIGPTREYHDPVFGPNRPYKPQPPYGPVKKY